MKRFDLYGSSSAKLEDVRSLLEQQLDLQFAEHESGYRGGIYYLFKSKEERIAVQTNSPDEEGYRQESEFDEQMILVYVSRSHRWDSLEKVLTEQCGLELLRTKII